MNNRENAIRRADELMDGELFKRVEGLLIMTKAGSADARAGALAAISYFDQIMPGANNRVELQVSGFFSQLFCCWIPEPFTRLLSESF